MLLAGGWAGGLSGRWRAYGRRSKRMRGKKKRRMGIKERQDDGK